MKLPEFPDLSDETLRPVLSRHGLQSRAVRRLPSVGIFNAIFAVGDEIVLRVPRQHPAFIEAARKEALAVPAARSAGVRTPALLVFDDTLDLLPVPYSLYERVHGETLELLRAEPEATKEAYRELGRDLAFLHSGVKSTGKVAQLQLEALPEPDAWPEELADQGYLGVLDARWLSGWLSYLKQRASAPPTSVFRHGDIQATNVMVGSTGAYLALLDWGGCGWGDAAHDFAGVALRAVPFMLEGYQETSPLPEDGSFEARVVLRQLNIALFLVRRPPQPDKSWAERPLGMLLEMLRFLGKNPDERWRSLLT